MTLLDDYDVLLLDLDGVVYRDADAVPHAVAALRAAAAAGVGLGFVTNNASRPAEVVAAHLSELGIPCGPDQVVTSAQVGAQMLAEEVPSGAKVLALGGPGVGQALSEQGLRPVRVRQELEAGRTERDIAESVSGVLQGFGPEVSWRELAVASYAVAAGAVWIATNTDLTIPRADGIAPGNGTLVAAVSAATGVTPRAAGKPAAQMMRVASQRLGARRPLAVGDRIDTDIRGAAAAGIDSLLVFTGVTGPSAVLRVEPGDRPTYVADDLRGLLRPLPRLDAPATAPAQSTDAAIAAEVRDAWRDPQTDHQAAAARITALLAAS